MRKPTACPATPPPPCAAIEAPERTCSIACCALAQTGCAGHAAFLGHDRPCMRQTFRQIAPSITSITSRIEAERPRVRDAEAARLAALRCDEPAARQALQHLRQKALRSARSPGQRGKRHARMVRQRGQLNHHAHSVIGGARQLHRRVGSLHRFVLPHWPVARQRACKRRGPENTQNHCGQIGSLDETITRRCVFHHRPLFAATLTLTSSNSIWRRMVQNVPRLLRRFSNCPLGPEKPARICAFSRECFAQASSAGGKVKGTIRDL